MPENILFFYNHFFPGYKAGGPVQSLVNLANCLHDKENISVITSGYDLAESTPLKGIELKKWNKALGSKVYYLDKEEETYKKVKELILSSGADNLYVNGMFSLPFVIYPIMIRKKHLAKAGLIIAPRGMVQEGALKIKPLKKQLFLFVFKLLGLHKNVLWHATDAQEKEDVMKVFGSDAHVFVAPNIPKGLVENIAPITKVKGQLRLVYLSVISEKKNLHLAIQWLNKLNRPIIFDIYGPVKDATYWDKCKKLISEAPGEVKIEYKGDVEPQHVQDTFSQYHAMLLPTEGENFGHAIYECLGAGRPVVISKFTPWSDLETKNAGFNINLTEADFNDKISILLDSDQALFDEYCNGAYHVAAEYRSKHNFTDMYLKMFGVKTSAPVNA